MNVCQVHSLSLFLIGPVVLLLRIIQICFHHDYLNVHWQLLFQLHPCQSHYTNRFRGGFRQRNLFRDHLELCYYGADQGDDLSFLLSFYRYYPIVTNLGRSCPNCRPRSCR